MEHLSLTLSLPLLSAPFVPITLSFLIISFFLPSLLFLSTWSHYFLHLSSSPPYCVFLPGCNGTQLTTKSIGKERDIKVRKLKLKSLCEQIIPNHDRAREHNEKKFRTDSVTLSHTLIYFLQILFLFPVTLVPN